MCLPWWNWRFNLEMVRFQLRKSPKSKIFQILTWNSFSTLKNAGLVKSIRGARGGYILARDPSDITVGEIIRALEGPIELAECIDGGGKVTCVKSPECVTRGLWKDISDSISNVIDNRSLQDLLSK